MDRMKKREISAEIFFLIALTVSVFGAGLAFLITPSDYRAPIGSVFHNDIAYCNSDNERQEMDIVVPDTATADNLAPVVLYVHGGGWTEGSFRDNIDDYYPPFLIEKGIAFATIDYRLAPEYTYPAQNEDIRCAYDYLQANAASYHLNMERVGFFGDSAGGQLAAMEALDPATRQSVDAVAMFYGVSDLWYQLTEKKDKFALNYLGKHDEALAKSASPRYAQLKGAPPFLLVHGTHDALVPHQESVKFRDVLQQNGVHAQLITLDGASHGFGDDNGSRFQAEAQEHLTRFFAAHLQP